MELFFQGYVFDCNNSFLFLPASPGISLADLWTYWIIQEDISTVSSRMMERASKDLSKDVLGRFPDPAQEYA